MSYLIKLRLNLHHLSLHLIDAGPKKNTKTREEKQVNFLRETAVYGFTEFDKVTVGGAVVDTGGGLCAFFKWSRRRHGSSKNLSKQSDRRCRRMRRRPVRPTERRPIWQHQLQHHRTQLHVEPPTPGGRVWFTPKGSQLDDVTPEEESAFNSWHQETACEWGMTPWLIGFCHWSNMNLSTTLCLARCVNYQHTLTTHNTTKGFDVVGQWTVWKL